MTTTTGNVSNGTGFGWANPPRRKRNEGVSESDDLFSTTTGDLQQPVNKETIQPAGDEKNDDGDDREEPASQQNTTIKGGNKDGKVLIVNSRQRFLEGLENFLRKNLSEEETISGVGPSAVASAGNITTSSSSDSSTNTNPSSSSSPASSNPASSNPMSARQAREVAKKPTINPSEVQGVISAIKQTAEEEGRVDRKSADANLALVGLLQKIAQGQS